MGETGQVRIFPEPEALSRAAAEIFVEEGAKSIAARGRFAVALAGGSTPRRTYELLAQEPYCQRLPWSQVHIFFGDERAVPPADPRSNYRLARETMLSRLPIPGGNVHPILAFPSAAAGAEQYEAELQAFFGYGLPRFDLVLLGMGPDGHVASLFPGSPALRETVRRVVAVTGEGVPEPRVTLTPWVINLAAVVVFLIMGREKAPVLREILQGSESAGRYPAALIRPLSQRLLWLVDQEAARLLGPEAAG